MKQNSFKVLLPPPPPPQLIYVRAFTVYGRFNHSLFYLITMVTICGAQTSICSPKSLRPHNRSSLTHAYFISALKKINGYLEVGPMNSIL